MLYQGETLNISANLRYSQYLISASHDNALPCLFGIISGSDNYFGVHLRTIFIDSNVISFMQGTGNIPLKINKVSEGGINISIIPIGDAFNNDILVQLYK